MTHESEPQSNPKDLQPDSVAAARLSCSPRTIRRWADEGRLTRYRITGTRWVRYDMAEIEALLGPATSIAS